jgi:hypothetical protein
VGYIRRNRENIAKDAKRGFLWTKKRDFFQCRVRIRAQNCLFWPSFAEKIDPMPEYVGKIYINKIANQPSSKAEHPHYRAN